MNERLILLILTNLAVLAMLSLTFFLLGIDVYFHDAHGLNLVALLIFASVSGFFGSFVSLLFSRQIALWSTGARVIERPGDDTERWLLDAVARLARQAGLEMPQVAIFEGEANAFATGPSRNRALVAVSTGLLAGMEREEVVAVLAHEVAHIENGDMLTLTLIQGTVNTFVFFVARLAASAVDAALRRGSRGMSSSGFLYSSVRWICEVMFGLLASMLVAWFSRRREFRADAGAARLMGSPRAMIAALQRLGSLRAAALPRSFAAAGIHAPEAWLRLFASHPPREARIRALETGEWGD
ncbi:MAG: protease HtpX [Candidatus Sericytochromatia bacterium]|nr:protease HtpX [Candidatus Sericytochromatia bacterium]